MTGSSKPAVWQMVETLTKAGLVVPPLGAVDPNQIREFDRWYWGTRNLDDGARLYTFNCGLIARNIAQHGPAFALSHTLKLVSLVTTSPSGDIAVYIQDGLGGAYADIDSDIANVNAVFVGLAQRWAKLGEAGPRSEEVHWLAYNSLGSFGIVDLDALRRGADFETAHERVEDEESFEAVVDRCAARSRPRRRRPKKGAPRKAVARGREAQPRRLPITQLGPYLAEALRRLEDDSHLVISVRDSIRYVQFATFRPNLRLETIGTRYLDEAGEAWSGEELVWLADHGWHDADDDGNLWRDWIPADEGEAAVAAVEALVNVHGVTNLDQVWFQSGDDDALAAVEAATARPLPLDFLQPPFTHAHRARINAILNAYLRDAEEGVTHMPADTKCVAIVDYVDGQAVLELLAVDDGKVFRRHDGRWYVDPQWHRALPEAPARSIVALTQEQFDRVLPGVDASTADQPWKPFQLSQLEMYWPSHRPNDPDLFDWSQLRSLDDLHEP